MADVVVTLSLGAFEELEAALPAGERFTTGAEADDLVLRCYGTSRRVVIRHQPPAPAIDRFPTVVPDGHVWFLLNPRHWKFSRRGARHR